MRKYCCDESRDLYLKYYSSQSGSGLPYFSGTYSQRGHGIGSVFSGLFRSIWPLIKSQLKDVGKQALKSGINIAADVVDGKSFKESVKHQVPEGIKEFAKTKLAQYGSGKRKRKVKNARSGKVFKRDIFS